MLSTNERKTSELSTWFHEEIGATNPPHHVAPKEPTALTSTVEAKVANYIIISGRPGSELLRARDAISPQSVIS